MTVVLHNTLPEATSIVFPGPDRREGQRQPGPAAARPGRLTDLDGPAGGCRQRVGDLHVHGRQPGTYLYESGTDVDKQVQMGLYGALVVRPGRAPDQVNDRADSAFNRAATSTSSCSPRSTPTCTWRSSASEPDDWNAYNARYFMINGRSMPDTLAPNNASWLPNQPYGALVHIKPYDAATNPLPAVIRYLNAGTVNYPFHPHGSDERVVNKDGQALQGRRGQDLSYLKYDIDVQPGQTVDALMDWRDVEQWNADDQPDPDADPGHHRPAPGGHRHVVQREPLPRHEEPAADDDHVQQRVRRVLPRGPQPRAAAGHQLRRDLRGDDDGLPHRPARRLLGEVRTRQ